MRFPRFLAAARVRVAVLALGLPAAAQAYNPPDQRTIYDEWIRDSQAKTAAEARNRALWTPPPKTEYTGGGVQARLEREARAEWEAGERRMRERNEAREAARRAREAELRELTRLYDSAAAGDPDSLMTLAQGREKSAAQTWGLRDYQRVYGLRRREALWRMVELIRLHAGDRDSLGAVLPLESCLGQLALLGDAKAAKQLAQLRLEERDFYRAGNAFAQAGAAGDAEAQKQAIRLVGEDRVDAVSAAPEVFYGWCRTWAAKGDLASQWVYGSALGVGGELPSDPAAALVVLRQAAAHDPEKLEASGQVMRARAALLAGLILLEGRGVAADPEAGLQLLQTAAEGDHAPAMLALGRVYLQGGGVAQNTVRALAWLTRAAEAGEARAAGMLAAVYLQEDSAEFDENLGLDWLRKAARRRPDAMLEYGRILAAGDHGVARDPEQALSFFSLAIQRYPNDPDVLEFIGQAYLRGDYGLKEKPFDGVRLLKRAVERGSRSAARQLAAVYGAGAPGIAPDAAEARQWQARAE